MPWALEPALKTPLAYLYDIICDIPGLMEDARDLQKPELDTTQRTLSHQTLSRNIFDHLNQLHVWRSRWKDENRNSCYEIQAPQQLGKQPLFPAVLYFSNPAQAYELLRYNIALILLLRLGVEIMGSAFNASSAVLGLPTESTNLQAISMEICKCVDYCLADNRKGGGVSLLVALRTAYTAFPPTSRQAKWVDAAISRVEELNGFEINKNIDSYTLNLCSSTI